jgi:hypothetical protein
MTGRRGAARQTEAPTKQAAHYARALNFLVVAVRESAPRGSHDPGWAAKATVQGWIMAESASVPLVPIRE